MYASVQPFQSTNPTTSAQPTHRVVVVATGTGSPADALMTSPTASGRPRATGGQMRNAGASTWAIVVRSPAGQQGPQGRSISAKTGRPSVGSLSSRLKSVVLREIEISRRPSARAMPGWASGAYLSWPDGSRKSALVPRRAVQGPTGESDDQ